jgi:hypothetical protein
VLKECVTHVFLNADFAIIYTVVNTLLLVNFVVKTSVPTVLKNVKAATTGSVMNVVRSVASVKRLLVTNAIVIVHEKKLTLDKKKGSLFIIQTSSSRANKKVRRVSLLLFLNLLSFSLTLFSQ